MLYKMKVMFAGGDIEWYLVSANNTIEAEQILFDMLDYQKVLAYSTIVVSPYPVYCISEEIYNELDYLDKSGNLVDDYE